MMNDGEGGRGRRTMWNRAAAAWYGCSVVQFSAVRCRTIWVYGMAWTKIPDRSEGVQNKQKHGTWDTGQKVKVCMYKKKLKLNRTTTTTIKER